MSLRLRIPAALQQRHAPPEEAALLRLPSEVLGSEQVDDMSSIGRSSGAVGSRSARKQICDDSEDLRQERAEGHGDHERIRESEPADEQNENPRAEQEK